MTAYTSAISCTEKAMLSSLAKATMRGTCWGVVSVMATPRAPLRPVRPDRCRYPDAVAGGASMSA